MTRLSLFVSGLLAFSVTACDDEVSEPTFEPTSVPESKPIDDLDEDEQQTFCEEATDWATDVIGDELPRLMCNSEVSGQATTTTAKRSNSGGYWDVLPETHGRRVA